MCAECTTQRARSHPCCGCRSRPVMRMGKPTTSQTSLAGTLAVDPPNYTQVPNTLIDDLMPKMKEAELKVTMAIARETFGWHRDEKLLSLTRLQALTGLSRQGVVNGIEDGLRRRVIERRAAGDSFTYRLLVNEVDQPSQRSRPVPVNQVDRQLVNEVDTAKKTAKKEEKKQGKKNHTQRVCVGTSRFHLSTCEQFAAQRNGVTNPGGYATTIFRSGEADGLIEEWLSAQKPAEGEPTPDPMPGTSAPESLRIFLEAVRKRVNQQTFQNWFAPIAQLSIEGDLVRLLVSDFTAREWINSTYVEEISEALNEAQLGKHRFEMWWPGKLAGISAGARSAGGFGGPRKSREAAEGMR